MSKKNTAPNVAARSKKPRFIVTHEYNGTQSMQAAFEQVFENQACSQFERWREKERKVG